MASLLRAALEGEPGCPPEDDKELMELKGPLSEVFSQALNQVYARPDSPPVDSGAAGASGTGDSEEPAAQVVEQGSGDRTGAGDEQPHSPSHAPSHALESQANDALALAQLINNVELASTDAQSGAAGTIAGTTVYGVSAADVKPEDIVEVSQDLAERGQHGAGPENYVVVMDATQPSVNGSDNSNPEPRVVELGQALETLVHAYGSRVYPSLEAFAKDWMERRQRRRSA
ncbi:hypothetical protein [Paraburkholderia adhaesiva]|uniref:hypothetical protein n=1 Tax=Paraburkholderia adhaesiva TaxID=2883244 RepID=UPI001F448CD7|nr:hypothetical protein [Paraburkholderia adhaesiva]